jgi:PIN domain nuclease of toxin-antitoxin system
MAPLLDTHAWFWWVEGDNRLDRRTRDALDELPAADRPFLAAISLWEIATLVERGRVDLRAMSLDEWLEFTVHPRSVRLVPVTAEIAAETASLPKGFHRDPADRLIVASCRVLGVPLVTRDAQIRRARVVPLWKPRP